MYIQNSTVRTSNKPAVGSGVAWSEAEPAEWQPELSRGFVWTCLGTDLILFFRAIFLF